MVRAANEPHAHHWNELGEEVIETSRNPIAETPLAPGRAKSPRSPQAVASGVLEPHGSALALSLLVVVLSACTEPPVETEDAIPDVQDVAEVQADDILEVQEVTPRIEVCAGDDCPQSCGPYEREIAGACVCTEDACVDPWTQSCIAQYWHDDFAAVSSEKDVLAEIRPDLLARYLDLDLLRSHVYEHIEEIVDNSDSALWGQWGYLLLSDHLCSLYQLGVEESGLSAEHVGLLLAVAENDDPKMYMPLVLASIVTGTVDVCALHSIIDSLKQELAESSWGIGSDDQMILATKGALTRYLVTIDFYGLPFDGDLVGPVAQTLYPDWDVKVHGVWDSELIYDLVNAYYLDLFVNEPAVLSALDGSWQPLGGVQLDDCVGPVCPIKGIHQVVFIDAMLGFIPEDKLVQIASLLLSNIQPNGSFGFPEVLGIDPSILWTPSYCDIFCSSKHWHISFVLNHLVARLEHRENDIKAGAALLELDP
jgi:hypothetical protein